MLDAAGSPVAKPAWEPTKTPCDPDGFLGQVALLVQRLPEFDRVSIGFPGVVRAGRVLTAPLFCGVAGPGSPDDPKLVERWSGFELERRFEEITGAPARLVNDAVLHALSAMRGEGVELTVTLGTGVGVSLAEDGRLAPHLELAHHPVAGGTTYNGYIGKGALERVGEEVWRRRVRECVEALRVLTRFDHLYIGGGNARLLDMSEYPEATRIDPMAGALGGVRVWESGLPRLASRR